MTRVTDEDEELDPKGVDLDIEDGEEMNEYELQREARIAQNNAMLKPALETSKEL